eukprot:148251-Amphidinium_carterae.1
MMNDEDDYDEDDDDEDNHDHVFGLKVCVRSACQKLFSSLHDFLKPQPNTPVIEAMVVHVAPPWWASAKA